MTVSDERRLERSSSLPGAAPRTSSRHHRQPSSRYGYSELTPILIFDKVAKSTSQVTENGWDVTTYQYQSGGYSQVKSKRMEINFGISGLLRGTGQQGKDKNKASKKKTSSSSSSSSTLPRRWSFKLPKLVERKEEPPGGQTAQVFVAKLNEANVKAVKTVKAPPPPPPPRRPALARSVSDMKERAWVTKIMLNEREHSQSGRQAKSLTRNNLEEAEEEKDSAFLSPTEGDLINVEIKEIYSSPMVDVTMPGFYSHTQSQPFQEQEFYENSENSESTVATVESFVDEAGNDSCSFEDIDTIMDTITENVNEMDLYDNLVGKDDEMDSDYTKDDNSSKTSNDDIIVTFNDQPKLKGKGSILKHPGQKRRHIKHVEFLDLICDDQGNSDSVRYF